jgi:hypothetical protein
VNNGSTINNYGHMDIDGNLNVNNGGVINNHFDLLVQGNLHVNGTINGNTLGGYGKVTVYGTSTLNSNGSFGVTGSLDICDTNNPTGGWHVKNGTEGSNVTHCERGYSLNGEFQAQKDGDWGNGATWGNTGTTPGVSFPAASDTVVIQNNMRVVVKDDNDLNYLQVNSQGRLILRSGHSLTISDRIVNNGIIRLNNRASLVQTDCSGANNNSGSGLYNIKRTGVDTNIQYNMWSSPIQQAELATVYNNTNPCDIYTFDETSQQWVFDYANGYTTTCGGGQVTFSGAYLLPNGDGVMDVGRGYFIAGSTHSSRTKRFKGQINNGTIKVAVATTSHGHQPNWNDDDWNLIGNPYPSAIDAQAFWLENAVNNQRIYGAIHFWDDDAAGTYNQYAEYATWNSLGGVSSLNSSKTPDGFIASGQGFWVEANTNDSVVFTNCMRSNQNGQFFKTDMEQKQTAHITLTNPNGVSKTILLGYTPNSSNGYDELYDAHQMSVHPELNLASMLDSSTYIIQGIKAPSAFTPSTVALTAASATSGLHTFSITETENLNPNIQIWLVDKVEGERVNLMLDSVQIDFTANEDLSNRFYVEFSYPVSQTASQNGSPPVLTPQQGVEPKETGILNPLSAETQLTNEITMFMHHDVLHINATNELIGDCFIYNTAGQLVHSQNVNNSGNLTISLAHVPAGMVIVQFNTIDSPQTIMKMVVSHQ